MKQICRDEISARGTRTGVRGYSNAADRKRAIARLRKSGLNHFVCFCEVNSAFALMYGVCDPAAWPVFYDADGRPNGRIYVDR